MQPLEEETELIHRWHKDEVESGAEIQDIVGIIDTATYIGRDDEDSMDENIFMSFASEGRPNLGHDNTNGTLENKTIDAPFRSPLPSELAFDSCSTSVHSGAKRNDEEVSNSDSEEELAVKDNLLGKDCCSQRILSRCEKKARRDLTRVESSLNSLAADATGCGTIISSNDEDEFTLEQLFWEGEEYQWDTNVEEMACVTDSNGSNCFSPAEIRPQDVLLGRGGFTIHHHGNIYYRNLVKGQVHRYMNMAKKREKTSLFESIVRAIHDSGGRFLKKNQGGTSARTKGSTEDYTGKRSIDCVESGETFAGSDETISSCWIVLSSLQARDKVSQRFREEAAAVEEAEMHAANQRQPVLNVEEESELVF